jgi:two-component system sensor histidine kinase BaeS
MRLRLVLSFTLVVFVAILTVVVAARQGAASQVHAFMFRGGMSGTSGLVSALEDYYRANQSWQGVGDLLSTTGHGQGRGFGQGMGMGGMMSQRLRVADIQGNVVADSQDPTASGKLSAAELDAAIALQVNNRTVGYLLPEGGMAFTPGDESALVGRLSRAALTAGLVAGVVSLLLALLISYQLLRPVKDLTQAARRLASGDLSQRVAARGSDELAVLGKAFNQMADALQNAQESRRALTADIAHELRTPLAVQRANLEALQDGVYPLTAENIGAVLEQNVLLTRLVDDLRTLALADAGQLTLERVPTDFPAFVQRVAERFTPQAAARQIALRLETAPGSAIKPVLLDPLRGEQILNNLLSNALRYTPEGGQVTLTLSAYPGGVRLDVHDSGPGIPDEALPYIFERFYRADKSRSRIEGGSGLGLAIARQLALAHGGSLTAANHPQGGAVFTLQIPL